jgi:RecB family endonuclease NucS
LPGGGAALAVAREFPVAAGSIDLVGVDPDGEVVVCECKLEANREARRMVVGQLFAYAGALWELSFDDFSERFASQAKATLTEAVAKMATADWDEEQFRQRVEANLAAGRFG